MKLANAMPQSQHRRLRLKQLARANRTAKPDMVCAGKEKCLTRRLIRTTASIRQYPSRRRLTHRLQKNDPGNNRIFRKMSAKEITLLAKGHLTNRFFL